MTNGSADKHRTVFGSKVKFQTLRTLHFSICCDLEPASCQPSVCVVELRPPPTSLPSALFHAHTEQYAVTRNSFIPALLFYSPRFYCGKTLIYMLIIFKRFYSSCRKYFRSKISIIVSGIFIINFRIAVLLVARVCLVTADTVAILTVASTLILAARIQTDTSNAFHPFPSVASFKN